MENFYKAINDAGSVFLALPTKPTLDQVAAALAIQLSLSKSKGATIYSPNDMTVEFNRLIGVDKITKDLGNKNLVIKLRDYPGENVERVSADIENGEFYLTIIPKPGNTAPKKDQLEFSYSGVSADTIILIGGANESHFPIMSKTEMANAKFVHIGVRELQNSRNIMSVGRPASSDSEIAASVILDYNFKNRQQGAQGSQPQTQPAGDSLFVLSPDVATNLLMGIDDASGGFLKDSNADTFMIVSQLMRSGGTRAPKQGASPDSFPQGSIPSEPYSQKPLQSAQSTQPDQPIVQTKPAQPTQTPQPVQNVVKDEPLQTVKSEEPPLPPETQAPQDATKEAPSDWMKPGKVYKGTNN
ncbi:hypothetical protein ACFL2C_01730 [Patescibacteria group bacterium]